MALRIGTNISSFNAQRRLGEATTNLSKSFERLSSGQRINVASDDPSGLALATTLKTDSRIYRQSIRNISDTISYFNIAESALSELSSVVARVKELAEQSMNGTYNTSQRAAMDAEAQELAKEYNRILDATTFNGINLFASNAAAVATQIGTSTVTLGIQGTTAGYASGTFAGAGSFAAATTASGFALYDFNADSNLDAVVTDSASASLAILSGNADGSFNAPVNYTGTGAPRDPSVGDFNGDGKVDIATANYNGNNVSIFIGNGNGTFKAQTAYTAGTTANDVLAADIDGDSDLDLLATNFTSKTVSVFLNNGNGTLLAHTQYTAGEGTRGLTLEDVNGDGMTDVAAGNATSGNVSILIGNGNGTFKAQVCYYTHTQGGYTIRFGDLDYDGDRDIAAFGGGSLISVLLSNGNGTFRASVTYGGSSTGGQISDLNDDGFLDLVGSGSTGSISVLYGNGNGTFQARANSPAGPYGASLTVEDVNKDGVPDVLTSDMISGKIYVLLGNTTDLLYARDLTGVHLRTAAHASETLERMDRYEEELLTLRGIIGSNLTRLSIALENTQSLIRNIDDASSRIADADVAEESTKLVRSQILQQAATAVLAQANQSGELVLELLR